MIERISNGAFAALIANVVVSTPLALGLSPVFVISGEDAWFPPPMAVVLLCLILYPLFRMFQRIPSDFLRTSSSWVRYLLFVPITLILYIYILVNSMIFTEVAKIYLIQTPAVVIAACYIGIACYASIRGIEVISRVAMFSISILLMAVLPIPLFLLDSMHGEFFFPMFAHGIVRDLQAILLPLSWFGEVAVLVVLYPLVSQQSYKSVLRGYAVALLIYMMLLICSLLILSAQLSPRFVYPALEVVRNMVIGDFVERIDAILVALWAMTMMVKTSVYLHLATLFTTHICRVRIRKYLVVPIGIVLVAFASSNGSDTMLANIYQNGWIAITLALLALMYLVALRSRKHPIARKKEKHPSKAS